MKKKLKGAALVYVVMMSFIVFLVAGMILLRDYLEYVRLDLIQERDWIRDQVRSVVTVLERDVTGMDGVEQVLPGVPVTFEMKTEEWGLLDVVTLVSGSRMLSDTTILLCGSGYGEDDSTALYMAGNQNYLSVVGNTELRGRCFLPSLGVRKGYVQGEGYYKDSVVYGEVRLSGDSLPGLSSRFVKNMEYAETDEETHDVRVRMRQSFHDEVLTCYSRFPICLTGHVLGGKIRVISEQRIRVV